MAYLVVHATILVVIAFIINPVLVSCSEKERAVVRSSLDDEAFRRLVDTYDAKLVKRVLQKYYVIEKRGDDLDPGLFERLAHNENVHWFERQVHQPMSKRGKWPEYVHTEVDGEAIESLPDYNDPLFPDQWYYQSDGQKGITSGSDHGIIDVWKMGYNGTGIKVVVIDDGLDHSHLDLADNYNATLSLDLNEDDDDPSPRIPQDNPEYNAHGTKCAGEIGGIANNGICGVGVAHKAQIGGIKLLDGKVTDQLEAEAFKHHCEEVDIYSMSWGPSDDGKTFGGFMPLSYEAIEKCIEHGRGGQGSIYVWASGNGGQHGDCCSADSLVSSPFTISIGALTHEGRPAYFQESCPSTIAAVYTGGVSREQMDKLNYGIKHEKVYPMVTTTIMFDHKNPTSSRNCDSYFSGTSAAGPLAAGMIALLLQSNPNLNWRDVQHIIVETCDQPNPEDADALLEGGPWEFNGDGRTVSHDFGFGVMNAAKMILAAKNWTTVPERHQCTVGSSKGLWAIPKMDKKKDLEFTFDGDRCIKKGVSYVEHAVLIASYESSFRGSVQVELKSPNHFHSILMRPRFKDNATEKVLTWPFVSFLHWGEPSAGTWVAKFAYDDALRPKDIPEDMFKAEVTEVKLILYGTETRHVNPSKSNPELTKLKKEEDLEKQAIQDQFEYDHKANDLIRQRIDQESDGESFKRERSEIGLSRREFSIPKSLTDLGQKLTKSLTKSLTKHKSYGMGNKTDFEDPYDGQNRPGFDQNGNQTSYNPRVKPVASYLERARKRHYLKRNPQQ